MSLNTQNQHHDFNGWLDSNKVQNQVDDVMRGADDGELYLQHIQSEIFQYSDQKLKSAVIEAKTGFGLRTVCGELVGFSHSNELTDKALLDAVDAVALAKQGSAGTWDVSPARTNQILYAEQNPFRNLEVQSKIQTLQAVDKYARGKDPRVSQVEVSILGTHSTIEIIRPGGERFSDLRPLVQLRVKVIMSQNGRLESGVSASGGRYPLEKALEEPNWRELADEAIRMASVNLTSVPAPAGKLTVVLDAGWPGVMVHEAVGHGLEGDAVHKGQSVYAGQVGEQVAAKGVTIVDNGAIVDRRGSLNIDDEGTPTQENVLIEDGILKGYMHDRLSARLMGVAPTGNGRRETYAHTIMPRMTNTYMTNGSHEREEILASVEDGIFAVNLGGGQVNPTSGDFVFECTEAYRVRNGKVEEPVKGATIIGNGPEAMRNVTMVGKDSALDTGSGTCGKSGQSVPVGVGQPMVCMESITVGGTA